MKHAKEKGATAKQAFPFLACFNEQMFLRSRKESSERANLRVCQRQKKRERLRSRHFLFLHVSTSKCFCEAERKALKERICESAKGKRKGSDCEAGISFSCMFQRANVSAKQKGKLCKSGFASLK